MRMRPWRQQSVAKFVVKLFCAEVIFKTYEFKCHNKSIFLILVLSSLDKFHISIVFNTSRFYELKALQGPPSFPLNAIVDRNDFVVR